MQGTWIRSLLGELRSHMPGAHALQLEKPPLEKATCHSKDPEQPKIKKQTNSKLHIAFLPLNLTTLKMDVKEKC